MRVKRYVADSIQEAIARVKSDLGRNAIILHTKPFKEGGFLGLFCKRRVEVIAAIDEDSKAPLTINQGRRHLATAQQGQMLSEAPLNPRTLFARNLTSANNHLMETAASNEAVEPELGSIREEIAEMKELIRQATFKPLDQDFVSPQNPEKSAWDGVRDHLYDLGLDKELVDYLITKLPEVLPENSEENEVLNYCRQLLEVNLMCSEPMRVEPGKQTIVALIGPTGVGKTTTIAKLAANFNLFEHKKVGLITLDTYRIAAVEHLKTYGDIMNLRVEVAYALDDLDRAIQNLQDCDLVLIDTAGRSPRNEAMMVELQEFLQDERINEILLVMSATTQFQDMKNIAERFARLSYTHLIFTKLDETSCLGPIISLVWKMKRPVSYLTTGQNVPDDIEIAKSDKLTTRLFEEIKHA